jgi:beta-phosphoglucomutase
MALFDAVLFDMDGVIMDSMEYHVKAWQEVYASLHRDRSREDILINESGLDLRGWYDSLHPVPLSPEPGPRELAAATGFVRAQGRRQRAILLQKYGSAIKPYPQALPLLRRLNYLNIPLALVTSSSRITLEAIVPLPLKDCFQAIIAAEEVERHKPDPAPYLAAAARLGVRPCSSLVVENSPGGIRAGLAAGAACVAIASTLPPACLSQADAVYPNLHELALAQGWEL